MYLNQVNWYTGQPYDFGTANIISSQFMTIDWLIDFILPPLSALCSSSRRSNFLVEEAVMPGERSPLFVVIPKILSK